MRLATCDKWHPNEPSCIKEFMAKDNRRGEGYTFLRRECRICNRERVKHPTVKRSLPFRPYGVLPRLTWAAPELVLG